VITKAASNTSMVFMTSSILNSGFAGDLNRRIGRNGAKMPSFSCQETGKIGAHLGLSTLVMESHSRLGS
jgi:hypothetical protein